MDKSWLELDRGDSCYVRGLVDFVEFAKQNGGKTQVCPCKMCLLVKGRLSLREMFIHLINYGMMKGYKTWTSHGEKSNKPLRYMLRQQWLAERYGESSSGVMRQQPNPTMDILQDQFPFQHEDHMNMNVDDVDSESIIAYERYNNLVGEAQTPLYRSCDKTILETILRAMQMKVESRLSDKGLIKCYLTLKQFFHRIPTTPVLTKM
ncbi:unnamed protein product [Rhodiola kirilowii]